MPVGKLQPTNQGVCGDENGIQGRLEQPGWQLVGTTLDAQSVNRCFADFKSVGNNSPAPQNSFDSLTGNSLTGNSAILCLQETR